MADHLGNALPDAGDKSTRTPRRGKVRQSKPQGAFAPVEVTQRREQRWRSFLESQSLRRLSAVERLREATYGSLLFDAETEHQRGTVDDATPDGRNSTLDSCKTYEWTNRMDINFDGDDGRVGRSAAEFECVEPREPQVEEVGTRRTRGRACKGSDGKVKWYASQIVLPDYMCDIPTDLSSMWTCYMRPEGPRGLLFCVDGRASIRLKNGRPFGAPFNCTLPRGGFTLIEVVIVYDECESSPYCGDTVTIERSKDAAYAGASANQCLSAKAEKRSNRKKKRSGVNSLHSVYMVDVLSWNDCDMTAAGAECRQWFLQSRYQECCEDVSVVSNQNRYPLKLVSFMSATADSISEVYHTSYEFTLDCLIFIHKEAVYIPGLNPLYLCWRDSHVSRWPIDSSDGLQPAAVQEAILTLLPHSCQLTTADHYMLKVLDKKEVDEILLRYHALSSVNDDDMSPPLQLNNKEQVVHQQASEILIKVSFAAIDFSSGCLSDIRFVGFPSFLRATADSLNRILFQYVMRHETEFSGLSIDAVLSVAKFCVGKPSASNCFEKLSSDDEDG